jgi:hypothetical protein
MNQSVPWRARVASTYAVSLCVCQPPREHDGAIEGRALLTVDVLGVGESQRLDILAGELYLTTGPVDREVERAVLPDARDLAACAVLDAGLSSRSVLCDERDVVAFS